MPFRKRVRKNGVPGLRILEREELLQMEPNLSDDVTCGLYAPTGGIVCPFHMTMAFAENAYTNGVSFFLNTKVTSIRKKRRQLHVRDHPHRHGYTGNL